MSDVWLEEPFQFAQPDFREQFESVNPAMEPDLFSVWKWFD